MFFIFQYFYSQKILKANKSIRYLSNFFIPKMSTNLFLNLKNINNLFITTY